MAALATFGRSSISHLSATDQIAHTVPSASVGVCMELLVCTIKPMGEARRTWMLEVARCVGLHESTEGKGHACDAVTFIGLVKPIPSQAGVSN